MNYKEAMETLPPDELKAWAENNRLSIIQSFTPREYRIWVDMIIKPRRESDAFQVDVPYIPLPLVFEICEKIPQIKERQLDLNIAVLYSVEIAYYLCHLGFTNITMITAEHGDEIQRTADIYKMEYMIIPLDKEVNVKFDCVLGAPLYSKGNRSRPLYYSFVENIIKMVPPNILSSLIIPIGWLAGRGGKVLRNRTWDNCRVHEIITNDPGVFPDTSQPTCTITFSGGVTDTITMIQTHNGEEYRMEGIDVRADFPENNGIPMVYGDVGFLLAKKAMAYDTKFAMKKDSNTWCVFVSDANPINTPTTGKTLSGYIAKRQSPFHVSNRGSPDKNRNHHICNSENDAVNLKKWLTSVPALMIFHQWATTHRNIGTNLGQVPAIIVPGEYSDAKALRILGLTDEEITLVEDTIK